MNGLRIRGFTADTDRVSVQSTEHGSFLLTRRKFSFLPARWTEVSCGRNELLVLKCNQGSTTVELRSDGGPYGDFIVDRGDQVQRTRLKRGERLIVELEANKAVFVHTACLKHPWHRDGNVSLSSFRAA